MVKISTITQLLELFESWGISSSSYILKGRSTTLVIYPSEYSANRGVTPSNFTIFLNKSIDLGLLKEVMLRYVTDWRTSLESTDELPF